MDGLNGAPQSVPQRKRQWTDEYQGAAGGSAASGSGSDAESDGDKITAKRQREGVLAVELTPKQRVVLLRPHSAVLVNIREYYTHKKTGAQCPSKKGVILDKEQWTALLGAAQQLQQHAEAFGGQAAVSLAGHQAGGQQLLVGIDMGCAPCFLPLGGDRYASIGFVATPSGCAGPRVDVRKWVAASPQQVAEAARKAGGVTVVQGLRPTKAGISLDGIAWTALMGAREIINSKAERLQARPPPGRRGLPPIGGYAPEHIGPAAADGAPAAELLVDWVDRAPSAGEWELGAGIRVVVDAWRGTPRVDLRQWYQRNRSAGSVYHQMEVAGNASAGGGVEIQWRPTAAGVSLRLSEWATLRAAAQMLSKRWGSVTLPEDCVCPQREFFELGGRRRLAIDRWKGAARYDVREWTCHQKPCKKGISLRDAQWAVLWSHCNEIDAAERLVAGSAEGSSTPWT